MFVNYFGVANIEYLDGVVPLLVVNVYDDEKGSLINNIILPFEGYNAAVETLIKSNIYHVWTSDKGLYETLLKSPFIAVEIRHKSDTTDTANAVQAEEEVLREIYGNEPDKPKMFAAIRQWISDQLIKLAIAIN